MPRHRSWTIGNRALCVALATLILGTATTVAFAQNLPQGQQGQNGPLQNQQGRTIDQQQPLPANSIMPCPFPPLNQEHRVYLDELLTYWESSSSQIDMFECKFNRWVYDPVFGPRRDVNGELPAKTISDGSIKYKTPDKGLFFVENIWQHVSPQNPQENPYQISELKEQWICDGIHIYEFEYENEQLLKMELPPELQGQGLSRGPLPFLFGAKKDDLLRRYWVRVITPKESRGEYWIEAYPKYPADAQNYHKVVVILAEDDFLPKATEIFDPNFHPQTNPARTVFEFKDRKIYKESTSPLDIRRLFAPEFFEPKVPRGWKEIYQPYQETAANPNANGTPRQ